MSSHFWLWLLYFVLIFGGGYYGYGVRGTNRYWFGVPLVFALFLFIVCWIIAGNPIAALLR